MQLIGSVCLSARPAISIEYLYILRMIIWMRMIRMIIRMVIPNLLSDGATLQSINSLPSLFLVVGQDYDDDHHYPEMEKG